MTNSTPNQRSPLNNLIDQLPPKARRGSKARCHLLTDGPREKIAALLTTFAQPWATVAPTDAWLPNGFIDHTEAQLGRAAGLLGGDVRSQIESWWLALRSSRAQTPNWDLASTCEIDGRKGLLLIEAKAHDSELRREAVGKRLKPDASVGSERNHENIARCIEEANAGLRAATGTGWHLSRDRAYQMSNRFASAWKLTTLGLPVVLVYLGFLNAIEMRDLGRPFAGQDDWESLVRQQSGALFPGSVWGCAWQVSGQKLVPLIRSYELPLPTVA